MIIPVRCWTCGKPLGHLWEPFRKRVATGEDPSKVLDDLGLTRYCCRRTMLGHVELIDSILPYNKMESP